jgi:hypothetical protein
MNKISLYNFVAIEMGAKLLEEKGEESDFIEFNFGYSLRWKKSYHN